MIKSSIIAWLSVLTTSLAIALDLPAQTNSALVNKHNTRGWTPKPTAKPKPRFDLLRREETAFFNYEAPDQTCGFISGDACKFPLAIISFAILTPIADWTSTTVRLPFWFYLRDSF